MPRSTVSATCWAAPPARGQSCWSAAIRNRRTTPAGSTARSASPTGWNSPACCPDSVDACAWADEEGHYGVFLGSRSAVGEVTEAEIDAARNAHHGKPMREALAEAGLAGRPRLTLDPARYRGYLEAHIEQGDELEALELSLVSQPPGCGFWTTIFSASSRA